MSKEKIASSIEIVEKPDWITFEDIHNVLWTANETNRRLGFVLKTSQMSANELQKYLGDNGKCFVALCGEELAATLSAKCVVRERWYAKGKTGEILLVGIKPLYQGKHIYSMLEMVANDYLRKQGCTVIELETAENNEHAINVYKKSGFVCVDYYAPKGSDHYNVKMIKWLENAPYSERYCWIRYVVKKMFIRLRYRVGKVKRFGI